MNAINFLPASYERRRRRRVRVMIESILLIVAAVTLLGVGAAMHHVEMEQRQHLHELERQLPRARQAIDEAKALRELTGALRHQLTLQRELMQPINQSQILATMSQLMPASLTMTEWHATVNRPLPEPYRTAAQRKRPRTTTSISTPPHIALTFSGVATRDGDLADLVGALDRHPIFSHVKLHYSRQIEFLRKPCRDFRMSVHVPLDFRIVPAQEVADAH